MRRERLPSDNHPFTLKIGDGDRALLERAAAALPQPENSWAPRLSVSAFVREASIMVARALLGEAAEAPKGAARESVAERLERGIKARQAAKPRSAKERTIALPFEDTRTNAAAERVTRSHASTPKRRGARKAVSS